MFLYWAKLLIILSLTKGLAIDIVKAFLGAEFEGDRHSRRINKITEIEKKYSK